MDQITYKSLVHCFRMLAVDFMSYEAVLQCYIYAVLNIKANENSYDKYDANSIEFEQMCQRYGMTERPKYIYDAFCFSGLCTELADHGLHSNYRDFLDTFAPYIVAQWDDYEAEFTDRIFEAPIMLYHILKTTRKAGLPLKSISEDQICDLRGRNWHIEHRLSADAFVRCWKAVFCVPMPKLNVPISRKLVEVTRLYRKHKVPGISLLKNYCIFHRYRNTHLDTFQVGLLARS